MTPEDRNLLAQNLALSLNAHLQNLMQNIEGEDLQKVLIDISTRDLIFFANIRTITQIFPKHEQKFLRRNYLKQIKYLFDNQEEINNVDTPNP